MCTCAIVNHWGSKIHASLVGMVDPNNLANNAVVVEWLINVMAGVEEELFFFLQVYTSTVVLIMKDGLKCL